MGQTYGYPRIENINIPHDTYCLTSLVKKPQNLLLANPQLYFESGYLHKKGPYNDLPQTIGFKDKNKHQWCLSSKTGLAGACGVFTFDVQRQVGRANKKIQVMWIVSPPHDTDVNWLAVSFGEEAARKSLYTRFAT